MTTETQENKVLELTAEERAIVTVDQTHDDIPFRSINLLPANIKYTELKEKFSNQIALLPTAQPVVYKMPIGGKEVWGIGIAGVQMICEELSRKGYIIKQNEFPKPMREDENYTEYGVSVSLFTYVGMTKDNEGNPVTVPVELDKIYVSKRQKKWDFTTEGRQAERRGEIARPNNRAELMNLIKRRFAYEINDPETNAQIKALRYGKLKFIPLEIQAMFIALAKKLGRYTEGGGKEFDAEYEEVDQKSEVKNGNNGKEFHPSEAEIKELQKKAEEKYGKPALQATINYMKDKWLSTVKGSKSLTEAMRKLDKNQWDTLTMVITSGELIPKEEQGELV
jgi:hypothetical protein